jgi:hypothetical protein
MVAVLIIVISLFILSTLALIWAGVKKRELATIVAVVATVIIHVTFWVLMRYPELSQGMPLVLAFAYELATIIVVCFTIAAMLQDHEYDL